jgi:hypothetical protein
VELDAVGHHVEGLAEHLAALFVLLTRSVHSELGE